MVVMNGDCALPIKTFKNTSYAGIIRIRLRVRANGASQPTVRVGRGQSAVVPVSAPLIFRAGRLKTDASVS